MAYSATYGAKKLVANALGLGSTDIRGMTIGMVQRFLALEEGDRGIQRRTVSAAQQTVSSGASPVPFALMDFVPG